MKKQLSEMSNEELWQLFPIVLTEHKPYWKTWFDDEVRFLRTILPQGIAYHHIGSTAVNGIMAKPTVDILIVTADKEQMRLCADSMQQNGYIAMSQSDTRISFNKGYTLDGFAERVFHLHIRLRGDTDEVYFRDYLNTCSEVAKAYEALKLRLWKAYEHDRDGYTAAKTEFVQKYTALAKQAVAKKEI